MINHTIIKHGDTAYIDSREVAEIIGRRHDHLLRDIGKYRKILAKGLLKIPESDFFIEEFYFNTQNRVMPCYLISKRGAEIIAGKLTGDKGIVFTYAYMKQFMEFEADCKAELKSHGKSQLNELNIAIKNVLSSMSDAQVTPERVMNFLKDVYEPFGIKVSEGGHTPCYYSATHIARINGIYSESGKPHGHAVASIISRLRIHASQMIAVPYGLVGVSYRYDANVANAVAEWVRKNNYPRKIPHLYFNYHVYYGRGVKVSFIKNGFLATINDADDFDAVCDEYHDCEGCPLIPLCHDEQ